MLTTDFETEFIKFPKYMMGIKLKNFCGERFTSSLTIDTEDVTIDVGSSRIFYEDESGDSHICIDGCRLVHHDEGYFKLETEYLLVELMAFSS